MTLGPPPSYFLTSLRRRWLCPAGPASLGLTEGHEGMWAFRPNRGLLAAFIGTRCSREPSAEAMFTEMEVRANTGLGSEKATAH